MKTVLLHLHYQFEQNYLAMFLRFNLIVIVYLHVSLLAIYKLIIFHLSIIKPPACP